MSSKALNKPIAATLSSQRKFLVSCLDSIDRILNVSPPESLHIHKRKGGLYYGIYSSQGAEHYLSLKSADLQKYIDKYCAKKLLPIVRKGIQCIDRTPLKYDSVKLFKEMERLDSLFGEMTPVCFETRSRHIKRWEAKKYKKNPFPLDPAKTYYNEKKEPFRSKNELLCYQVIQKLGLSCHYDAQFIMSNGNVVYTDFIIMSPKNGLEYYIEIMGRMSDPQYVKDNLQRIKWYMESGILPGDRLILFFESDDVPFDVNYFEDTLRKLFLS